MMKGSNGTGGKRYQITAMILTYAAVSLAAIPIALANGQGHAGSSPSGASLLSWILVGLASPFLELQDPLHGGIGLVILFVGIQIAWKLTRGKGVADIQGPYDNSASAAVMR